jgi:putative flavoprotein involved in K+ transport
MHHTDTVIIGAGHAGLAVSRLLTATGHEHVVLDRGRVAERWRSERWDSLHLLTPNWMTRLPGFSSLGPDPDGHLPAPRLVRHLEAYAASFRAPVLTDTGVQEVAGSSDGYRVDTDRGSWRTRSVVIATGPGERPRLPGSLRRPDPGIRVVPASGYRNPDLLPPGGVLVVGASSSGVQIADELARAGRQVVVAVGRHTRVPRSYRGMDIFWWLERTGRLARTIDEVADAVAARREPSLQLVGRGTGDRLPADLDLGTLQARGVRLTGRLAGIEGTAVQLQDDLRHSIGDADRRLERLLDSVDRHVDEHGLTAEVWPAERPRPVHIPTAPTRMDLRAEGIGTVLFATGSRPHHPWLRVPVNAADGSIVQDRGVTPAPGLYVVGQRFQHRRDSSFLDGARHDAAAVVGHLRRTTFAGAHIGPRS